MINSKFSKINLTLNELYISIRYSYTFFYSYLTHAKNIILFTNYNLHYSLTEKKVVCKSQLIKKEKIFLKSKAIICIKKTF